MQPLSSITSITYNGHDHNPHIVEGCKKSQSLILRVIETFLAAIKKLCWKESYRDFADKKTNYHCLDDYKGAIRFLYYGQGSRCSPYSGSREIFKSYCDYLKSNSEETEFMENYRKAEACFTDKSIAGYKKSFQNDKNKIAIPVVISGYSAAILIDNEKKTIEFYSPKGEDPGKRILSDGSTLLQNLNLLRGKLFGNDNGSIKYTRVAQQKDIHNSGIHVCHFFSERVIEKTSYEDFIAPKKAHVSMEEYREYIIGALSTVGLIEVTDEEIEEEIKKKADGFDNPWFGGDIRIDYASRNYSVLNLG